jgi:serine/threonine protein kinase
MSLSQSNPVGEQQEPSRLLAELIRLGKVTPFQANVLLRGLPIPLSIGEYRLVRSLESELGKHWFQAIDSEHKKSGTYWMYLLRPEMLLEKPIHSFPPSFRLADQQVAINHPSIDKWMFVGVSKDHLIAVCRATPGRSLGKVLRGRRLDWSESAAMVEQIAAGLQKLHGSGLVHGRITSESVWCTEDGEYILRRDPLFLPVNPYESIGPTLVAASREESMAAAAPELSLPGSKVTVQSDLYALGGLWFHSLTQSPLFAGKSDGSTESWAKAHRNEKIDLAVGEQSNPALSRCLAHLLAKNPKARFETAGQFIKAVEFALASPRSEKPIAVVERPVVATPRAAIPTAANPLLKPRAIGAKIESSKMSKPKKPVWLLPSIAFAGCLLFGALIALLMLNGGSGNPKVLPSTDLVADSNSSQPPNPASGMGANIRVGSPDRIDMSSSQAKTVDPVGEIFSVVSDNGKMLWAPPQAGQPYSLELLPPGLEGIIFLSGGAWQLKNKIGGVGKWWLSSEVDIEQYFTRYPLLGDDRIEAAAVALYPSKRSGQPQAVVRLTLKTPVSIEQITTSLKNFEVAGFDAKSPQKQGLWVEKVDEAPIAIAMEELQTSDAAVVKRVTIGPRDLLISLAEFHGGSAPLRRQLETLLSSTDSRADMTILIAPSFLYGDGRELLATIPVGQAVLREAVDETIQAVSLTTTWEPSWYVELRMIASETRDAGKFASTLKQKMEQLPNRIESGLVQGDVHPYWRALAMRYPTMLRTLSKYARFGLEDGQVIANVYLPTDASANLAIASWMAIKDPLGLASSPVGSAASLTATKPATKSIDEILDSKINVSFEQESLEAALQLIASEVSESILAGSPLKMAIQGAAFQKDGITQNQQIRDFRKAAVPLRAVLTDLVRRANPVTTVQSPTEKDQKVVWIVQEDPSGATKKKIDLTTRGWAEANKAQLPKEFVE